jgi:hypothetical protein
MELGPGMGAQLVMPRLGEPVEPAYAEDVKPWWRGVDERAPRAEPEPREAPAPAADGLPKEMPWPID